MDYVIGLGANLGSRRANLEAAVALLSATMRVTRCSPIYESAPVGPTQPDYVNAAVRVHSELSAHALLARLLATEALLGRVRSPAQRWGPRTLDLDVLWAEQPVASDTLAIPHAHLRERWFALGPLLDVAPELESDYGAALAAQGGRRSPHPEALARDPRGTARALDGGGEVEIAAEARDLADAWADALGALGRHLASGAASAVAEAQVLRAPHAGAGDRGAAFVRAALDQSARGFAFARASIVGLEPATPPSPAALCAPLEGRLLGVSGAAEPKEVPVLLGARVSAPGALHRVAIRVARRGPQNREETGFFR